MPDIVSTKTKPIAVDGDTITLTEQSSCFLMRAETGGGSQVQLTLDTVSGESISAGDLVSQFRYGVRKGFGLKTGSAEINHIAETLAFVGIAWLTSSKFVCVYRKSGGSKIYAKASILNTDWTITSGAEVTIANYATSGHLVRRGADDTFIVAWTDNATRIGRLFAAACTVADTTITVGAEAEINPSSSVYTSGSDSYDFRLLTASTLLFAYRDTGDSNYLRACVVTWSGTTLTVNADVRITTTAVDDVKLAVLSSTRAHVYYEGGGSGFWVNLIKVSGTVPSAGTAYGPTGGFTSLRGMDATPYSSEYTMHSMADGANVYGVGGYGYLYSMELPAAAYNRPFGVWTTGSGCGKTRIHAATQAAFVLFEDIVVATLKYSLCRLAWQSPQWLASQSIHASGNHFDADLDPSRTALAIFFTDPAVSNQGNLLIYDVGFPIGIAQENNSGGSPLLICHQGLSEVHSGLVPYFPYYGQTDGTLISTNNGWLIGRAIAADSLLVDMMNLVI